LKQRKQCAADLSFRSSEKMHQTCP
jgi:hypothetical protein